MSSANLSLASTTSNHCSSPTTSTCSSLWLEGVTDDKLYHFGLYKSDKDLKSKFGDVKFVCIGGSPGRLCAYAELFAKNMNIDKSCNLSHTDRFSMWKTGPVLWINATWNGRASLSIMLVESIKLLHYAGATNFQFIRLGTSGGVGVTPGTIVVSNGAVNGLLEEKTHTICQGEIVKRDAILDQGLSTKLYQTALKLALPMRLDGLFYGVKNIEMESTGFAAFTHRAGIPAAILCVAVVNRMRDDQVVVDKDTYHEFEMRPFQVVYAYIKECMLVNST
uniref:Nucleoside phosphorylase domain-containing protein n=1 Tax=Ditylenchus dipsaci TaxID=166011 RepID=A0A915CTC9_9BILA